MEKRRGGAASVRWDMGNSLIECQCEESLVKEPGWLTMLLHLLVYLGTPQLEEEDTSNTCTEGTSTLALSKKNCCGQSYRRGR